MTETQDKVIELLNEASLSNKDSARVTNLKHVQELILNKEPTLLDNFLEEMLQFQLDKSGEVKKCVISFIEEACKRDPEIIVKIIDNFRFLLYDDNINVQKRAYLAMINMYKNIFKWLAKIKSPNESIIQTWNSIIDLKKHIIAQLDSDNDGIRTSAIKFIELIILISSPKLKDSKNDSDLSIDQIPDDHKLLNKKHIFDEGKKLMEKLIDYSLLQHISSVNLILCMSAMSNIARYRPEYLLKVLQTFDKLLNELPPTLGKSQISSVKKQMKLQLITILKQCQYDLQSKIVDLLLKIGVSQNEINKVMPKMSESSRKRASSAPLNIQLENESKKARIFNDSNIQLTEEEKQVNSLIDDLSVKLSNKENIADLVLITMVMLPDVIPMDFKQKYKPVSAAGTQEQIRDLAKLMASHINKIDENIIDRIELKLKQQQEMNENKIKQSDDVDMTPTSKQQEDIKKKILSQNKLQPKKISKVYRLTDVTKPLNSSQIDNILSKSFKRLLNCEDLAEKADARLIRNKVLLNYDNLPNYKNEIVNYIFNDTRKRIDLGTMWIYNNYLKLYSNTDDKKRDEYGEKYNSTLATILSKLQDHDPRDLLFSKILLETPCLTDSCLEELKKFCLDETRSFIGISTLKDLIISRPNDRVKLVYFLLDLCYSLNIEVRRNAIRVARVLHQRDDFKLEIEKFALERCKLLLTNPNDNPNEQWSENDIRICFNLYLDLMPLDHTLIQPLAQIYLAANADIKKMLLLIIDQSIKEMGMQSQEILKLIEECPKGSEPLIIRIIQLLTDKTPPSNELVEKVRDLYTKRIQDIRLLIPILNALPKSEIISYLPQIIKLSQNIVKEIFNKIWSDYKCPLNASELMVQLHLIDSNVCDLKTIINATSLCFSEKQVYTQDILINVLQTLVEVNPIPTLFMRTCIQTLSIYPKLSTFIVNNILQKLLIKQQIWLYPKVWEGFIKCCQRTKPTSFNLLLQLPIVQLKEVFTNATDLKDGLQKYLRQLNPMQRTQIPPEVIQTIGDQLNVDNYNEIAKTEAMQ